MPKIIHIADVHFDSGFSGLRSVEKAAQRREEQKMSFSRVIDAALDVDILLIAGDLFNTANVSTDTVNFIVRKFAQIPRTKVFIAAGNHDFIGDNSPYNNVAWGKNVHIFGKKLEKVELEYLNTDIYGVSQSKMYNRVTLLEPVGVNTSRTSILLMHGDVISGGTSDYNPIFRESIEKSGMNYVALGHVHQHGGIKKEGRVYWSYAGVLEGRGFDETGDKGYIIGNIHGENNDLEFRCNSQRRNFVVDIDLCADTQYIIEKIFSKLKEIGGNESDLYEFILHGELNSSASLDIQSIVRPFFYAKVINKTHSCYDYRTIALDDNLRGTFVKLMLEKIESLQEEEKEIATMALNFGLASFEPGGRIPID